MTKPRLLLSLAVVFLLVFIGSWVAVGLIPRAGVTKANYDRIRIGMTQEEAEQLMGRPPDIVQTEAVWWPGGTYTYKLWETSDSDYYIKVDSQGKVCAKRYQYTSPTTMLEHLGFPRRSRLPVAEGPYHGP